METQTGFVEGAPKPAKGVVRSPSTPAVPIEATLGRHLARRLVEVGVSDVFSVPCDFNLTLLEYLLAEPGLNLVGCCNELNAIAGAYSENLPVICIVGGPNSNDYGKNRILHHTIGLPDLSQELRCFQPVTCFQSHT